MKNITVILFAILLFSIDSFGQQIPIFNNYLYNPVLNNPARTGQGDYANLFLNVRKQWSDMPNSPDTRVLTFDTPFKSDRIGVGTVLWQDQSYIVQRTGGHINYAYHIPVDAAEEHHISMGMGLGMVNQRINFADAPTYAQGDLALIEDNTARNAFDMTFGVNYNFKGLDVDFSLPQLISKDLRYRENDNESTTYNIANHYLASVGYKAKVGKEKMGILQPVVLLRGAKGVPIRLDVNVLGSWRDIIWLGAGVRTGSDRFINGVIGSVGFKVKKSVHLYYNYEYTTKYGASLGHTHGLAIGYSFGHQMIKLKKRMSDMETEFSARDKVMRDSIYLLSANYQLLAEDLGKTKDIMNRSMYALTQTIDSLETELDINQTLEQNNEYEIEYLRYLMENDRYKTFKKSQLSFNKIGSVYFEENSYKLLPETRTKLRQIKEIIDEQHFVLKIYIAGHASKEASKKYNLVLSNQRIKTIEAYLKMLGIDGSKVFMVPYGEQNPLTNSKVVDPTDSLEKERRVDIFIIADNLNETGIILPAPDKR